ncbi:MAG: MFS transporter [Chloroflexi bacterium]|nr:MFS transporter [Chloroflexota bacterium]
MSWQSYHTVWAVLIFTWVSSYLARIALSPALGPIQEEFGLSHAEAGALFSVYFYTYTSMQIPAGILGDRLGRKALLMGGAAIWGGAAFLTAFAGSIGAIVGARLLTGLGGGVLFSNDRAVITTVTPREKLARGLGISFAGPGLGLGLGIFLGGLIAEAWGWRAVFLAFALPAILAAGLIRRFVPEPPRTPAAARPPLRLAFTGRDLWFSYLAGFTSIYCLWVLGSWTPIVLREAGVGSLAASAALSSVVGFVQIPSMIAAGLLTDRLAAAGYGRKGVMAGALVLAGISMALVGGAVGGGAPLPVIIAFILLATFFYGGTQTPMFALWAVLAPAGLLGLTFGAGNSICFLGSLVAPPLTGWLRDTTGSFAAGFYVSGALLVLGGVLAMAVRPAFRLGNEHSVQPAYRLGLVGTRRSS